jgi:hypothetical protein
MAATPRSSFCRDQEKVGAGVTAADVTSDSFTREKTASRHASADFYASLDV